MTTNPRIEAAARAMHEAAVRDVHCDETPRSLKSVWVDGDVDFYELATAALAAAGAAAWRPMDSAPRDTTPFWGRVGDDAIAMFWHPGFEQFVSSFSRIEMAPGYTIDGQPYKDHSPVAHKPEAWMPLPPPPQPDAVEVG